MADTEEKVIRFLQEQGSVAPLIQQIILFGSRARGDATDRSDFDIAIVAPDMTHGDWAKWSLELQEKLPALCGIDLLLINEQTSEALKKNIHKDGKIIYEKN